MLRLSCTPQEFKSQAVLHLVHPQLLRDAKIQQAEQLVKTRVVNVCKLGETVIQPAGWDRYDTIVLHDFPLNYWQDMLRRLAMHRYLDLIQHFVNHPQKICIVYSNAIRLLSPKVTILPMDNNLIYNDSFHSAGAEIDRKGLNIIHVRIEPDAEAILKHKTHMRVIEYVSKKEPIYLLEQEAVYTYIPDRPATLTHGCIYRVEGKTIQKLSQAPMVMLTTESAAVKTAATDDVRSELREATSPSVSQNT